jgi:hypothetical protein
MAISFIFVNANLSAPTSQHLLVANNTRQSIIFAIKWAKIKNSSIDSGAYNTQAYLLTY